MKPIDRLSDAELTQALRRAVRALPDVPASLEAAAIGLMPAVSMSAVLAAGARAAAAQIRAVLSFDSWAAPAPAQGMRSLRSPTRHLLFNAEGRDIDLRISPQGETFSLAGQVLGPDDAGRVELLAQGAGPARSAELDALGEFRVDGLPAGCYVLTLELGADRIELPAFEVGACPS